MGRGCGSSGSLRLKVGWKNCWKTWAGARCSSTPVRRSGRLLSASGPPHCDGAVVSEMPAVLVRPASPESPDLLPTAHRLRFGRSKRGKTRVQVARGAT
jgi:hypothetical protein